MKKLAIIVFFAAVGLTWIALKTENAVRRKRLAVAAAVCWGIVVLGFLV
ncbi:MAG: hypothetical protein K9K88_03625 [Desulfobacterales bacterium]|nr:hypothetical protein [Desulfobacterales bacterium]